MFAPTVCQEFFRSESISKGKQSVGWRIHYISFIFLPVKIMALNSSTQLLTIDKLLPPEIMSEIFILSTVMHDLAHFDFEWDISTPSRLSLTLVCKSWCSIARSTPALWTTLRIYIPYRNMPQLIQDLQQSISRSGQLPLSIQVHHHPSVLLEPLDPLVEKLIHLVKSCWHRWENLDITPTPELLPLIRNSISGPSILKTLILSPAHAYNFRKQPFNIGASFPSPTYVSLSVNTIWPLEICWDNVTRFTARHMGVGQALEILRLPPQLREFTLFELWRENNTDLPSSPILHSRLETLHVYRHLNDISYQLMKSITLPSLKHFSYNGRHLSTSSVIDFLDRSGCSLETFSLRDADIDDDDIINLLCAMPHLETLTLESRYITDILLNMLADTTGVSTHFLNGQKFLPKLRSLICIGRPIFSWLWLYKAFGRHGINESSAFDGASFDQRPLRSFRVDIDDSNYPEPDVIAELKRLREEGYDIDITKSALVTI